MIRINRISRCGLVRRPKPAPPIHSSPGAARRRRGSVPRDLDFRAGSLAESLVCSFVRDAGGFRVGFATDLSSDISIHCLHLFRSEPRHLRPQRRPSPGPFASSRSRTERCPASPPVCGGMVTKPPLVYSRRKQRHGASPKPHSRDADRSNGAPKPGIMAGTWS